ncbi:MAG: hypothetical protein WCQ57_04620 [Verrucomicrobiota bacterium]
MSRTLGLPLFAGIVLFCAPLLAANPLVTFPSGDFTCTVAVTPHEIPKPDPEHPERRYPPVLKTVTITRIGTIRRDASTWSDGSASELWDLADMKLALQESRRPGKDIYLLRGYLRDHAGPALLRFDDKSVSWITAGAVKVPPGDSDKPLHYQAAVVVSDPGEIPTVTATYQAWIDPKTLLPQKFDDGEALYVLTFSKEPPIGPLVIPANIQREIDRYQAAYAPHPHL